MFVYVHILSLHSYGTKNIALSHAFHRRLWLSYLPLLEFFLTAKRKIQEEDLCFCRNQQALQENITFSILLPLSFELIFLLFLTYRCVTHISSHQIRPIANRNRQFSCFNFLVHYVQLHILSTLWFQMLTQCSFFISGSRLYAYLSFLPSNKYYHFRPQ